jgi:cytoskeletal protein CcmA (bactofilin family)
MSDAPRFQAAEEAEGIQSSITRSFHIRGEVSGREPTRIAGCVDGALNFEHALLKVESGADIRADIAAGELLVFGHVRGNTCGQRLEVRGGGTVVGDVAAEITVDHRGIIRGRVDLPGRLAPAVAIRASTVLVLEDESKPLSRMLAALDLKDYSILTACTSHIARRLFENASVALVLMDAARSTEGVGSAMKRAKPTVPIVVLSENWSALESMGFADLLLSKAIGPERLRVHLRALLGAAYREAA